MKYEISIRSATTNEFLDNDMFSMYYNEASLNDPFE